MSIEHYTSFSWKQLKTSYLIASYKICFNSTLARNSDGIMIVPFAQPDHYFSLEP